MKTVVMDTSNAYLVIALYENDKCLEQYQEFGNKKQSEYAITYLDEMLKRKMTVRDLQDALELDSPQSIYKWLRGESLPSLPNMLVLGELFKVPLERLLVHEDGSVAYHRIFDDSLPYEIAYLVQDKDDFSVKRRHVARADTFAGTCYSGIFNLPQECPHSKAPHN